MGDPDENKNNLHEAINRLNTIYEHYYFPIREKIYTSSNTHNVLPPQSKKNFHDQFLELDKKALNEKAITPNDLNRWLSTISGSKYSFEEFKEGDDLPEKLNKMSEDMKKSLYEDIYHGLYLQIKNNIFPFFDELFGQKDQLDLNPNLEDPRTQFDDNYRFLISNQTVTIIKQSLEILNIPIPSETENDPLKMLTEVYNSEPPLYATHISMKRLIQLFLKKENYKEVINLVYQPTPTVDAQRDRKNDILMALGFPNHDDKETLDDKIKFYIERKQENKDADPQELFDAATAKFAQTNLSQSGTLKYSPLSRPISSKR